MRLGLFILPSLLVVTVNLYLLSKPSINSLTVAPLLTMSQVAALFGSVLLSFTFVLSSRMRILEILYGGLDRVYQLHHRVGTIAFILLLQHPVYLIVHALPNYKAAVAFIFPYQNATNMLGFISIVVLLLLMIVTLYLQLPYHVWKKTHELMGIPLLLGTLHIFYVPSDISRFLPLRYWMLSVCALGLIMYLYKRIFYGYSWHKHFYIVLTCTRTNDILDISLKPVGKPLSFHPGQFIFIRFPTIGDRQAHPFSISSGAEDSSIRISVKIVGDHTLMLRDLKQGMPAEVWGPHGVFSLRYFSDSPAVLIGGGIGITPFLSMIKTEQTHPRPRAVYVYYCTSTDDEAVYDKEIQEATAQTLNVRYILHASARSGRLSSKHILSAIPDISRCNIFLCGPPAMMLSLRKSFMRSGIKQRKIFYEDFSLA